MTTFLRAQARIPNPVQSSSGVSTADNGRMGRLTLSCQSFPGTGLQEHLHDGLATTESNNMLSSAFSPAPDLRTCASFAESVLISAVMPPASGMPTAKRSLPALSVLLEVRRQAIRRKGRRKPNCGNRSGEHPEKVSAAADTTAATERQLSNGTSTGSVVLQQQQLRQQLERQEQWRCQQE